MPQPPREAVRVPSLSPVDRAKMTAQVEVFRDGSNTPQRPLRRQHLLDWVYGLAIGPSWFAFSSTAPQAAK